MNAPHDLDDYMRRRNLASRDELTAGLIKMATVPEGSEVRQNPAGWAPCTFVHHDGGTIVIMPGPPKELEAVFTREGKTARSETLMVSRCAQGRWHAVCHEDYARL